MTEEFYNEADYDKRRRERLAQMKRLKEKQLQQRRRLKILVPAVLVAALVVGIGVNTLSGKSKEKQTNGKEAAVEQSQSSYNDTDTVKADQANTDPANTNVTNIADKADDAASTAMSNTAKSNTAMSNAATTVADVGTAAIDDVTGHTYYAKETDATKAMNGDVYSNYGIFIDLETNTILAERNSTTRINPASMTKILTVLVAAEQLESLGKLNELDDTFTMTLEITDYGFVNDCSNVGFLDGEVVTVRDLLYGTILPSGADAAVGLATYVSGSHEAFVELMNAKVEELGLSETTHFTNCVGIYDEEHYSTVYDVAMIMEAAMDNELCREIMGTRTYTTSLTEQHPEGITVSNWFIRRIEDKDTGGEVLCAKTGYVVQSGSCAASYGRDHSGREYICVTADAHSSWRCIYDHVALYSQFSTAKEEDVQ